MVFSSFFVFLLKIKIQYKKQDMINTTAEIKISSHHPFPFDTIIKSSPKKLINEYKIINLIKFIIIGFIFISV